MPLALHIVQSQTSEYQDRDVRPWTARRPPDGDHSLATCASSPSGTRGVLIMALPPRLVLRAQGSHPPPAPHDPSSQADRGWHLVRRGVLPAHEGGRRDSTAHL